MGTDVGQHCQRLSGVRFDDGDMSQCPGHVPGRGLLGKHPRIRCLVLAPVLALAPDGNGDDDCTTVCGVGQAEYRTVQ